MPLKILYLDDEPELCEFFAEDFGSPDCEVTTFSDPDKALVAARQAPPDIIFVDFRLPGTTGDKIAREMPAGIPIFLITGDINLETKFGFAGILQKPYALAEIQDLLQAHALKKLLPAAICEKF